MCMGRFVFFTYFDGVIYKRKSLIRILQTLIGYAYVIFIEMRDVRFFVVWKKTVFVRILWRCIAIVLG